MARFLVQAGALGALIAMLGCAGGDDELGKDRFDPPPDPADTDTLPPAEPLPQTPLEVCVNELWPRGVRGPTDAVELFNPGSDPITLQGWRLADDPDKAHLGMLLDGVTVPPRGAVLLDALPFALDAAGESVVLTAPDGRGSIVSWTDAPIDAAVSRVTDCCVDEGCLEWRWLGSPGASNGVWLRNPSPAYRATGPTGTGTETVTLPDPTTLDQITVVVFAANPIQVWWNGAEIGRIGLSSTDPPTPLTSAVPELPMRLVVPSTALIEGDNTVEVSPWGDNEGPIRVGVHARGGIEPGPAPLQPVGVVSDEEAPPVGDATDRLFTLDRIHRIDLTLTQEAIDALDADAGAYVEGQAVVDGDLVDRVGVKRRGKLGSLRPMSGKPKLRLDLNRFVPEGELWGVQALQLNSAVQDCAFVREPMGYAVFAAAGMPVPREAYARLTLNGEDYGQYYVLEDIDDRYLARWFADPGGTLYDGSYVEENGNPLALTDFTASQVHRFDLESGPDVGGADVLAVQLALDAWEAGTLDVTGVGTVLDWSAWHTHLAVEEWVGHADGYLLMPNNYWVYFDPVSTLATPLTWDTDQVFLHDWQWFTTTWHDPDGRLAALCFADPACAASHAAAVDNAATALDAADLVGTLDHLEALSLQGTLDDPKRECGESTLFGQRADVRAWLGTRSADVRASWGL